MGSPVAEEIAREMAKKQPRPKQTEELEPWVPAGSPSQLEFYWDRRPIVIATGERASGKSFKALDKVIDHCYRYDNAVGLIFVIQKSSGKIGGVWEKLISTQYKPDEKDEQGRVIKRGAPLGRLQYWHDEIGLEFFEERGDDDKNRYVDLVTKNGKLSRIYFKSLPPGATVAARMKGIEASIVLIDEIGETKNPDYVFKTIQQIRRPGIPASAQQLILTTNPPDDGPDHWLGEWLRKEGIARKEEDELLFNHNDHEMIGWYHVKFSENVWFEDRDGYLKKLAMESLGDGTATARTIEGRWKKKQSVSGIFEGFYQTELVVRPQPVDPNRGFMPMVGESIILGYDPGATNQGRSFMQRHWTSKGWLYRIFDELVVTDTKQIIDDIVRQIMDRMVWWNRRMEHRFNFVHISDRSAFDKYSNISGSMEYMDYERVSRRLIIKESEEYGELSPIKFLAPEKGAGSVADRVLLIRKLLATGRLLVGANCMKTTSMFMNLKKKKKAGVDQELEPASSVHKHIFDALSYPPLYFWQNEGDELPKKPKTSHMAVDLR